MHPEEAVNSPLSSVVQRWLSLIEEAKKVKHQLFGQYAEESAKFFDSVHNFMWSDEYATSKQGGYLAQESFGSSGMPTFRMSVNPVSDAVRLFGPALYHRNPNIVVEPKLPPKMDAMDLGLDESDPVQAQAAQAVLQEQDLTEKREKTTGRLCQHYLNWLQLETDKKVQSKRAIDDAIVKGMGVAWTEIYQPPNSAIRHPRTVYMSCDDLVKDPDARYQEDVQWIARRCVHPVNLVEEKYGYKPGELRGNRQSLNSQQSKRAKQDAKNGKRDSKSFDEIEYWEIYSKNGFGQHLKEAKKKHLDSPDFDLSIFGKYCYLAVCNDIPFPLNIPPRLTDIEEEFADQEQYDEQLQHAAAWPIPFWEDEGCNNGWPCAELAFYESPDHIWPIPLVKPAIGEIRFVNWVMSYLGDRTAASCKNYLAVAKQAMEEFKQQASGQYGPFAILEMSALNGNDINKTITWLTPPPFDESIWTMVSEVLTQIDKRTGLTELVYGLSGRQMRSAEEARVKNENTTIRPDEMASRVEDWLGNVAMKEIEAAIWALEMKDYIPVFGQIGSRVWAQNVFSDENFYEKMVRNFTFRVEAGSARKPNKAQKADQLTQFGQIFLQPALDLAMGGMIEPLNAYLQDMADAMDLKDPQRYLLQTVPQPPDSGEAELEIKQQEADMKMQVEQAKLQMQKEKLEMELAAKQQEMQLDAQQSQQEMEFKAAESQQNLQLQQVEAAQNVQIKSQQASQDAQLKQQQSEMQNKQNNLQLAHKTAMDQQSMKLKEQQAKAAAKNKPKPKGKK